MADLSGGTDSTFGARLCRRLIESPRKLENGKSQRSLFCLFADGERNGETLTHKTMVTEGGVSLSLE